MRLTVKYFAMLREAIGRDSERVECPDSIADVAALRDWLTADRSERREAFAAVRRVRAAVNGRVADERQALADGDEVAFFPPVTGG